METGFFSGLNFALTGAILHSNLCMKRHPVYYGIQYVHKGPVYLSVGNGPVYHLEGPVLFLTSPETEFSYGSPPGTEREQYHICVNGERMKRYVESGLFPLAVNQKQPYCRILSPNFFLTEILNLMMLIRSGGKYDLAVCQFEHLLLLIQNQTMQQKESGIYRKELEEITQKIVKSPEKNWNFNDFARSINISGKHFLRIFSKTYGMSPWRFVLQQRIFKACSLLLLTKAPVKSIADECGFSNPFYFSRLFKKYMQTGPGFYRRAHSED